MKNLILGVLLISMSSLLSCELLCPSDDEDECLWITCQSGPFYSDLDIRVTINEETPTVLVEVFIGNIEDDIFLFSAELSKEWTSFNLEANTYYSVMAFYQEGDNTIVAINGKTLFAPSDDCGCDYDGGYTNLDVRLGD